MKECSQDTRLEWFGHRCVIGLVNVEHFGGSFPRGLPRKSWDEVIRIDLKERKVSKDTAKYKCLEVMHQKPSNSCKHGKQTL